MWVLAGAAVFFVATGHTLNPLPRSDRSQAAVYAELEALGRASRLANWALSVAAHQTRELGLDEGTLKFVFGRIGPTNQQHVDLTNAERPAAEGWTRIAVTDVLSPDTAVQQLKANGAVQSMDYVSMDEVGADCFVFRAIACELQPRVSVFCSH